MQLQTALPIPTGTSGHLLPYLDGANTWSAAQTIYSTGAIAASLTLMSVDAGPDPAPVIELYRNSASPAAFDAVGVFQFRTNNSALATVVSWVDGLIIDPTAGAESLVFRFITTYNGAQGERLRAGLGIYHPSVSGGDKGNNTLNYGTLYESGASLAAKYGQLAVANAWTAAQSITAAAGGLFSLNASNASASPLTINFVKQTTGTAANDYVGQLAFYAGDSANNSTPYAQIQTRVMDPTDGSEDSYYYFANWYAGVSQFALIIGGGLSVGSAAGGDKGPGTLNAITLFENNTSLAGKYGQLAVANAWTAAQTITLATAATHIQLTNTDAGATGSPQVTWTRDSASPAAGDSMAVLMFQGKNSANGLIGYNQMFAYLVDPTAGSEDSSLFWYAYIAGVNNQSMRLNGADITLNNASDMGSGPGPFLDLTRSSTSPAANDQIGQYRFVGLNSAAASRVYGAFTTTIADPTNGSEDSTIYFYNYLAGAATNVLTLGQGAIVGAPSGGDKGSGTFNVTTLYEAGTSLAAKYGQLAVGNTWTVGQTITLATAGTALQFSSPDAGANAVDLNFVRTSASPAASDLIGRIINYGYNTTPSQLAMAYHYVVLVDPTAASEDTLFDYVTFVAGASASRLRIGGGLYHTGATGTDKGNNTLNFGTLYENGTSLVAKYGSLASTNTWTAAQTITNTATGVICTLISTDAGAVEGPIHDLYRNSASPAANDAMGGIYFSGKNSAAAYYTYSAIVLSVQDVTAGSEDARIVFRTINAGVAATVVRIGAGLNTAGEADMGVDTINATTLYEGGTSLAGLYGRVASANTWNGVQAITGSISTLFSITSTAAGATGVLISVVHDSVSPAAADTPFALNVTANDSGGTPNNIGGMNLSYDTVTTGAQDSSLKFLTMVAGTRATRLTIAAGLRVGSATGGDKGAGTVNASAVYDDNVLLTSQPASKQFFDTGTIDIAAWDAMVPGDREHTTAHIFQDMLDAGFDPRDPEQFVAKFRADEVLPGMPSKEEFTVENHNTYSIGEIFSRLWLALDCAAVAMSSAIERVVTAEARIAQLEASIKSAAPAEIVLSP